MPPNRSGMFLTKADASGPAAGIADVTKVDARHEPRVRGNIAARACGTAFG